MRQAAKNRWFSVQSHLFFIPFFTHKELCELLMKSASRQNAEAQKFVQQKTTLAAAGQRLYNQTKSRKEGFQVNIKIIQRQCGGTEFLSQPHRLHLGAQNAAGVDELCFTLPEAWAGCTVALYLRRSDGTLLAPVSLDTQHCVTVDGTHTVHFFGPDEELELTHRAASRQIFVNGALHIARLLPGRPKGVYDLQKILFGA